MSSITQIHTAPAQHRTAGWPTLLPLLICCFIVLFFAGCATQSYEAPVAQLTRAEAAVTSAIEADARQYAAVDLKQAQDHLESAKQASADEHFLYALQFAEKAQADAELAEAKSHHGDASNSLAEIESAIDDLENQLNK